MTRRPFRDPAVLTLAVLLATLPAARGDDGLRGRLKEGWKALEALDESRVSYTVVHTEIDPSETTRSPWRVETDWVDGFRRMFGPAGSEKDLRQVFARNPYYAFALTREAKGEWRLLRAETEIPAKEVERVIAADPMRLVFYPLSTTGWGLTLPQLAEDKQFVIDKATPRGDRLDVHFRHRQFIARLKRWANNRGIITVDPGQNYRVDKWTFLDHKDLSDTVPWRTITREYAPVGDAFRLTRHEEAEEQEPKRDLQVIRRFEFSDFSTAAFSHTPFRLTHYGLPEPAGVPPPPSGVPRYVWLLLSGAAFLTLAVLGHWYLRRRAAPQA